MEPPSGNMDGDRLARDNFIRANFSICDAADEEVHFSRDVVASGYAAGQKNYDHYGSSSQAKMDLGHHQQPTNGAAAAVGAVGAGANLNYQRQLGANQDQIKSNKLLHCIGSKLRRGSNYLAAPKLVGQYLLGITIQSWSEFLNSSRLMRAPTNRQQLTRRLLANLNHFQGNYMCVSLILVIYCILTSPLLLIAIIAYLASLYLVTVRSATGRHMRIAGFRPNLQQQYSFITLISMPLLWVAGAPSAVFWVIGASFVVVGLHASMYGGEPTGAELPDHQRPANGRVLTQQVQHYNHQSTYLSNANTQHYIAIPPLPTTIEATTTAAKEATGGSSSSYSSAISQWITFGSGPTNKLAPGGSSSATGANRREQAVKLPDVTIVSQDYAGLGRVYEV